MSGGFDAILMEYYSVPISGASIRLFYNMDLLKEITHAETLPGTYRDLLTLCAQAEEYGRKKGNILVPIAGSQYNAPYLMERLYESQTQKLVINLNPFSSLDVDNLRRGEDFLAGRWSLDSGAVRSGLTLMRDVGRYMQPGFNQLLRDDATLLFVQGHALMICTGSWDATSIRQQSGFRIGVSAIPFPSTQNPVYGKYTLGALSEAGFQGGVRFGLTRKSPHPEQARDFLQFMASRRINQIWTDTSGWIPCVAGTKANAEACAISADYGGLHPRDEFEYRRYVQ